MIDIKDLPREPLLAAKYAIDHAISKIGDGKVAVLELKQKNHPLYNELFMALTIARESAKRISRDDLKEQIIRNVDLNERDILPKLRKNLEYAIGAILATEIDEHFINSDEIENFDRAELTDSEKNKIRMLMSEARRLVDLSNSLRDQQKRRVIYFISRIENELHKTKSTFHTFLAAAYEISGLVRQFGEDVQPIADAIEKAKTITEKKVEGYKQISQDERPKQLPKPDEKGQQT